MSDQAKLSFTQKLGLIALTVMTGGLLWLIRQEMQDQAKEEETDLRAINILQRRPGHPESTPMATIYLVRHAEDGLLGSVDKLTEKGEIQATAAGQKLNELLSPHSSVLLLSGSAPRCMSTAEIIGKEIDSSVLMMSELSDYAAATLRMLRLMQKRNGNCIIVAVTHEPVIKSIALEARQRVGPFIENGSIWPIQVRSS